MGLGRPGHRIAHTGDREAAQGETVLSGAGCNPVAGKMVGPLPSLMRAAQDHHAESAVSQANPVHHKRRLRMSAASMDLAIWAKPV